MLVRTNAAPFNRAPVRKEFEPWLTKWWRNQSLTVMYSEGTFTHKRLDRTLGSLPKA